MKRVKMTAIVKDDFMRWDFQSLQGFAEMEKYEEKPIPKEPDLVRDHSFEALTESALQFANGLWSAVQGFFGMTKVVIIMGFEGIRYLWRNGAGQEKRVKKK